MSAKQHSINGKIPSSAEKYASNNVLMINNMLDITTHRNTQLIQKYKINAQMLSTMMIVDERGTKT